jgi:hypothetical protein
MRDALTMNIVLLLAFVANLSAVEPMNFEGLETILLQSTNPWN